MQLISGIVLLHEDIEYLRKKDCAEQKKSKKKLGSKAIGKTWESDKQFN